MPTPKKNKNVTLVELAELMRVAPQTLYNRRAKGSDLPPAIEPAHTHTRRVLFDRETVEKWLRGELEPGRTRKSTRSKQSRRGA